MFTKVRTVQRFGIKAAEVRNYEVQHSIRPTNLYLVPLMQNGVKRYWNYRKLQNSEGKFGRASFQFMHGLRELQKSTWGSRKRPGRFEYLYSLWNINPNMKSGARGLRYLRFISRAFRVASNRGLITISLF